MDQKTRGELLKLFESKLNQAMSLYLETCSRCGVCTKACHVHESMPHVKYIAAYRAEIVRRIYKRYFKKQGKLWSTLGESKGLTDMALKELYEAAYSKEGADLLYVSLAGAHSIIPAAAIFNAAGEDWTLSFFEAVNFGAFVGDPTKTKLILKRIIDEARRLKVKEVCICECGTAFRVMKQQSGDQPFKVSSITELHVRYLKEGRIKLDKSKFKGTVTYHDPCQMARNAGIIDEPRYVLSHLTDDFRDMTPDPRYNWCCGGGGGLVALGEDTLNFRMKSSTVKVDQIKETGASILATACENCHTQLSNLNDHYKMGVDVHFLSSMVADALVH